MSDIPAPPSASSPDEPPLREWRSLSSEEQTALVIAHGHYLDSLPPTCHVETKVARLRAWLRERGIRYSR
jgi:hypothetical protein